MKHFLSLFFLLKFSADYAQKEIQDFNLGFEKNTFSKYAFPDGWFHWGLGYLLEQDTIQKHSGKRSMLIKQKTEEIEKTEEFFGCIAYAIPADYNGESITLKAYVKFEDVRNGYVGLLLRIDGNSGVLQSDDMSKENMQGSSNWKQISVVLPYPKEAKTIYIGAILSGTGMLWVDDFEVFLDGKNIEKIPRNEQAYYKADKDNEFEYGSKITTIKTTQGSINDLVILGKIWGFLKYYHPNIRKGDYNWDYELIRFLPKFLELNDESSRNDLLCQWITSLGQVKSVVEADVDENVYIKPDLNWINEKYLGPKLYSILVNIKNAEKTTESYYIEMEKGVGNPIFKNERTYSNMKYPDVGFRLINLFRYWNMIEYFFPYKNVIGEEWGNKLTTFIPKFVNSHNELEYKLTTLELIASIHDTHANIWGLDNVLEEYKGNNFGALKLKFIDDKAVVTGYYNDSLGKETGLLKGDIIKKINNKDIQGIVKDKLPLTPASNYETQLRDLSKNLLRTNDSLLTIEYLHFDSMKIKKINCVRGNVYNRLNKTQKPDTCYKLLAEGISYLFPENLNPGDMRKIIPKIVNTKGLIVDLRCYPGEFIVFSLGEFLLPEKKEFVRFSHGDIDLPGSFSLTDVLTVGKKNQNCYKGKVIILVNEQTQSQAEYTAMALRVAPNAIVIGSTTAGADGNVSEIILPGGIQTMISGIGIFYPDGRATQRIGIIPDIEVKPTINGVKENKDEVLERAIFEINKN